MEQILLAIARELTSSRHAQLKATLHEVSEFLKQNEESMMREPPHLLRVKCTDVFKNTLRVGNAKVSALTSQGLQKLLREDRFADAKADPRKDEELLGLRLPSQIISCMSGAIGDQPLEVQRDLMRVLLCIACDCAWAFSYRALTEEYSICLSAFAGNRKDVGTARSQVQTAAQTAFCQGLRAYAQHIEKNERAKGKLTPLVGDNWRDKSEEDDHCALLDVLPLVKFLSIKTKDYAERWKASWKRNDDLDSEMISRVEEDDSASPCPYDALVFTLEGLNALLSAIHKETAKECPVFISVLWQHCCPALVGALGTPVDDAGVRKRSSGRLNGADALSFGLGSSGWNSDVGKCSWKHAKIVYSIAGTLVGLVAQFQVMRPVLESLYHRMLFYPAPEQRVEAVKALKDLVKNPVLLLKYAGPFLVEEDGGAEDRNRGDELALLLMSVHASDEMAARAACFVGQAVELVTSLLGSLEALCTAGESDQLVIPEEYVVKTNSLYPTILSADYAGPTTYKGWLSKPQDIDGIIEDKEASSVASSDDESMSQADDDAEVERDSQDESDDGIMADDDPRMSSRLQALRGRRDTVSTRGRRPLDFYHDSERRNARKFADHLKSQEEFIDEVQCSGGVLVYLSSTWLAELYQLTLARNFLEGCSHLSALTSLLTDLDGLGLRDVGSQMLSDFRKLIKNSGYFLGSAPPSKQAGMKLARRMLTGTWSSVLSILSRGVGSSLDDDGTDRKKLKPRDVVGKLKSNLELLANRKLPVNYEKTLVDSLEGLQKAARLCNILGFQAECGAVFDLLATASCSANINNNRGVFAKFWRKTSRTILEKDKNSNDDESTPSGLSSAQLLSVEVMLTKGLELGSHCPDCWPHLFRCIVHVSVLETNVFHATGGDTKSEVSVDELDGGLALPAISLPVEHSRRVGSLSVQVERLFSDAASKLNMKALLEFTTALVVASRRQLFEIPHKRKNHKLNKNQKQEINASLMRAVSDVLLKAVKSGRPLVHIMKAWSIAGPHLMEIVSSICEFIECYGPEVRSGWRPLFGALRAVKLSSDFESASNGSISGVDKVLCDVFSAFFGAESPQVVANAMLDGILCLMKHVTRDNEGEGFNALDCLDRCSELLTTYHGMASPPIFHSAHRVKPPSVPKFVSTVVEYRDAEIFRPVRPSRSRCCDNVQDEIMDVDEASVDEFVLEEVVEQNTTTGKKKRKKFGYSLDFSSFEDEVLNRRTAKLVNCFMAGCGDGVTLESLDDGSGIYFIWYALIEGMMGSIPRCTKKNQSRVLFALFEMLEKLYQLRDDGIFAVYCVNHLVLPWCQDWLRRHSPPVIPPPPSPNTIDINKSTIEVGDHSFEPKESSEADFLAMFKQCVGLMTDLVSTYVRKSSDDSKSLEVLVNQTLVILVELCNHPKESVARIGCACFRHLTDTAGPFLTRREWELVAAALFRALALTVRPLATMIDAFKPGSTSFYGDVGQIKVMARKDLSTCENTQLRRLTTQVFLLESQLIQEDVQDLWKSSGKATWARPTPVQLDDGSESEERSYVFLLCPPCNSTCCREKGSIDNMDEVLGMVRVPFSHLVVGLVAHQLLLQNVAKLLLSGSERIVHSLAKTCLADISEIRRNPGESRSRYLEFLAEPEINVLMEALRCSQAISMAFDDRPGLKFLLQKVGGLRVASNLYRQSGAAWTVRFSVAIERFLSAIATDAGVENSFIIAGGVRAALGSDLKKKNTIVSEQIESDAKTPEAPSNCLPESILRAVFDVRDSFRCAVEAYIDIVEEDCNEPERPGGGQGIFFLVSRPDDLPVLATLSKSRKSDEASAVTPENVDSPQESGPEIQPEAGPVFDNEKTQIEEKVYDVVTSEDIENLRRTYAKRKMAWSFRQQPDVNNRSKKGEKLSPASDEHRVSSDVKEERESSILKDKDAKLSVWSEMLTSAFDLLQQTSDDQFRSLLPCVFPSVLALVSHAVDLPFRQTVADFLQRVSNVYGFSPDA
ncbi:unnamed protein product [Notodromas monacha]|uniref:Uncharacterized protein n=1 Tax=Notodromas monacha TaxID=399045 RepID=A0A7R9BK09_9CRUS|nr:unnamed protein product [Notodromas monacha]CAG0916914.1 unnamed protein product [Notodromas monacha]